MKNFMSRLQFDSTLNKCIDSLSSFTSFSATSDDIRNVHQNVVPDLELAVIADEYADIQISHNDNAKLAKQVLSDLCLGATTITENESQLDQDQPSELAVTLSRIIVCKPHSADCERLISAYNRLKTFLRTSLDRDTISDYLYVHVNMPVLCNFDPRPAVWKWMNEKERRAKFTPKASKQEWFKTVFDKKEESLPKQKKDCKRKF